MITKEERIEKFKLFMNGGFSSTDVDHISKQLDRMGFFEAPASISHHGNVPGGLFDHSLCVAESLVDLTNRLDLKWERKRSPYLVGMLHDLCKCDNYVKCPAGVDPEHWEYNNATILPGHGEKSVIMVQQLGITLTPEELACIRWHMGAFDDSKNWNNYGRACTQFHNVLFTHTADMIAARIKQI